MHTHQPDARSCARLTKAIEHFFVYPAAIVSYFQSYLAGRSPDGGFASTQGGPNESAQFIEQEVVFTIELDYVSGNIMIVPIRDWGER
jgi:hypothetical protein